MVSLGPFHGLGSVSTISKPVTAAHVVIGIRVDTGVADVASPRALDTGLPTPTS